MDKPAFGFRILVLVMLIFGLAFLQGCEKFEKPSFKTPYQAVLLDNGFAYFGKVEQMNESFVTLTDVFYIQTQSSPDGKQVANILVKRGKEWHGPDRMYIHTRHVIMIEPVSPDSQVAKLIKEGTAGGGEAQQK